MKLPIYIINFKTYKEAIGENAINLARICKRVADKKNISLFVAPQPADIFNVSKVGIKTIAQHIDPIIPGRNTGFILAEDVKANGAIGTLLNHSEHKIRLEDIKEIIKRCHLNKLITIVCASDFEEAKKIEKLKPDYIAIEPPELIAGKVSVSEASPEIIAMAVKKIKIPILCGAGINKKEDVKKAFELGVSGILVSSAFVLSKKPEATLKDIVL
ncbi:MAG: triose-phosphate isomerase [Candidatus Woesearchaeota archaeon]